MAALEVIALVEGTPQLRAPGSSDTYTMPRAVDHAEQSVTGVKNVVLSGETAEYNAQPADFVAISASHTYDYSVSGFGVAMPAAVRFSGTHTLQQAGWTFGMGALFVNSATFKNDSAFVAAPTSFYNLYCAGIHQADAQTLTQTDQVDVWSNTTFNRVSAGAYTITNYTNYNATGTLGAGCTMTNRRAYIAGPITSSGTFTSQAGFLTQTLTGATNNTSVQLGSNTLATDGNYSIRQVEALQNHWNGGQRWKMTVSSATSITATAAANHYYALSSTSTVTLTLPDATTCAGLEIVVKKTGASGSINITSVSSQTFDGAASPLPMATQWRVAKVISDGSNWLILKSGAP